MDLLLPSLLGDCPKTLSVMGRGGFNSEISFCFPGSPKFEQERVLPCAKYVSDGFEFQTCRRVVQIDSGVRENGKGGYEFSGRPMAYADDLFLNGKVLPLKLRLPPCKQGTLGTGTPVSSPSPSPSPRSPLLPSAIFSFHENCAREDDFVIDPFMVALENVKCDKKRIELNMDFDFKPFESTQANQRRLLEPRGVEFSRKLRLARRAELAEEMKQTGTEPVGHVPKRRRIRNFFSWSKRSVLRKLGIGGSSGSVKATPIQKANQRAVFRYKPNKILPCLGYGGKSRRYS